MYFRGGSDIFGGNPKFLAGMIYFSGVRMLPKGSHKSGGGDKSQQCAVTTQASDYYYCCGYHVIYNHFKYVSCDADHLTGQ